MSENLTQAMQRRREARRMRTHNPLRYAAYRRVTFAEQQLTDDEYAAYQRWAADTHSVDPGDTLATSEPR